MAFQLLNNAEGQSSGTTVTQGSGGNSGGASGNYFDEVAIGANMTETFDNTSAGNGVNSYKMALTSTATAITYVGWTSASVGTAVGTMYGAVYFLVHSAIASSVRWISFYNGSTLVGRLGNVNGLQGVQWRTQADAGSGTISGTLTADVWYRCEFTAIFGASGVSVAHIYTGNTTTEVGTGASSVAGALNGATTADHVRIGFDTANFSSTSGAYIAHDDINLNDTALPGPGPYGTAAVLPVSAQRTSFGPF